MELGNLTVDHLANLGLIGLDGGEVGFGGSKTSDSEDLSDKEGGETCEQNHRRQAQPGLRLFVHVYYCARRSSQGAGVDGGAG